MTLPRILLLGAGGRAGRILRAAARPEEATLILQSRCRLAPDMLVVDPGTTSEAELAAAVRSARADLVVCLWGAVPGQAAVDFPSNTRMAQQAYRAASRAGVPRFAALSSGAVYGLGPEGAFVETDPCLGTSAYALSKIAMERDLETLAQASEAAGLVVLRMANLFGADQLADAMQRATLAQPLVLHRFADGTGPQRSYASGRLFWQVLVALAAHDPKAMPAVLNLADRASGVEMAAILKAVIKAGRPVPWQWADAPPEALRRHLLDPQALFATFPHLWGLGCDDAPAFVAQLPVWTEGAP